MSKDDLPPPRLSAASIAPRQSHDARQEIKRALPPLARARHVRDARVYRAPLRALVPPTRAETENTSQVRAPAVDGTRPVRRGDQPRVTALRRARARDALRPQTGP